MKKIAHLRMHFQLNIVVLFSITILCACSGFNRQETSTLTQRYRIFFERDIVGHITFEKKIQDGIQHTRETLELHTQFRGMDPIITRVVEVHEEDLNGHPLHFSKHIDIPNADHYISGAVQHSALTLLDKRGDNEQSLQRAVPDDFLLREGLRGKMGVAAQQGKTLTYSEWDYDVQNFVSVHLHFTKATSTPNTWHVLQESERRAKKVVNEYYLDKNFSPLRISVDYFGKSLLLEPCQDLCASDNITALRPLDQQMLASPYQITPSALKGRIRYELQMHSAQTPPATSEQLVQRTSTGWLIDVCIRCDFLSDSGAVELAGYLEASTFMETMDPQLIAAAQQATVRADTPAKKMEKLSIFTRQRLEKKPQFAGYATALQAYQSRSGDCTEYALLLAALGRVVQVPTRVVFGLSYSRERFHGKKNAFAPHAWVQAWVGGVWRSYDAGLEVFDAGHIALRLSNGDQQDFTAMFENFSQLKIINMQQIVKSSTK
ncbi:MAG: transglutaminase-like domain-containing protein [Pseudomonadota bacterium]